MQPEKPKPQTSAIVDPNKWLTKYYLFDIESNTAIQENEQQDSTDENIEAEIKGFFATKNFNAETEEV